MSLFEDECLFYTGLKISIMLLLNILSIRVEDGSVLISMER